MISIRRSALRDSRRSRTGLASSVAASCFTAVSFGVVLYAIRPVGAPVPSISMDRDPTAERIMFVTPRAAPFSAAPKVARMAPATEAVSHRVGEVEPPLTRELSDSGSATRPSSITVPATTEPLAPLGVPIPSTRLLPPGVGTQSPFSVRSGRDPFAAAAPPSPAERDSTLADLSESFAELVARRVPTRSERDSTAKEAMLKMRNTGRILIVPPDNSGGLITVSIPLPFPGSGRSKARRARDRAVHDENRARLERLRQRADSMRRAREDSLPK